MTGGSYGGYMTNWIVGHTNRFKAAVTLRSISNFISDDGTRDGAYGHADDFGGDIFEKYDLYWERSPLKYVKNVKTPTLILHSDNDYRVPIEQGEQWFRALQHFGDDRARSCSSRARTTTSRAPASRSTSSRVSTGRSTGSTGT